MADPVSTLVTLFEQTANHLTIATAQQKLDELSLTEGFIPTIFQAIVAPSTSDSNKLRAAVYFKNHVMRHWVVDEGETDVISASDRELIKASIVALYMGAPTPVDAQFEHALGIISHAEFPQAWPDLLSTVVACLSETDGVANRKAFKLLNTLTFHFRVRGETSESMAELGRVDAELIPPMKRILAITIDQLQAASAAGAASTNPEALTTVLTCIHFILETFHSLMFLELYTDVENDMNSWFAPIASVMVAPAIQQATIEALPRGPTKAALVKAIDLAQTSVCAVARLFAEKYEEEFTPFVETFVSQVWALLTEVSAAEEYDALVSTAISFLSSMSRKEWYKALFENNLAALCEKIAIPQLQLRESDEELFEENWADYVSRDMLGADQDTRRRTAADLVTALCVHFEPQVTEILKQYIAYLLGQAAASPDNWKAKDVAMYVVLALTVKSKTRARGAVAINPYVDIGDFFTTSVIPELESTDLNEKPIIKADCLKFITQFRSQLPAEALPTVFALAQKWLACPQPVVHSYAAIAIEKLLAVKDEAGAVRLPVAAIADRLGDTLAALFGALQQRDSGENEHVMLAILRVVSVGKELVFPFASAIIGEVAARLTIVAQNPRQPKFNHNLFEVLACLIHYLCKDSPATVDTFVNCFLPIFEVILGTEACNDLQPYTFQVLAQLLELSPTVPESFAGIFPSLLLAVMWETQANCPAIARLLAAYLDKGFAPSADQVKALLGIFRHLNAHSKLDGAGFTLLRAIATSLPAATLSQYLPEILRLQFTRYSAKKTPAYHAALAGFYAAFVLTHGVAPLLAAFDAVQAGMSTMAVEKIWIPALAVVSDREQKAIAARGAAVLVTFMFETGTLANLAPAVLNNLGPLAASVTSSASVDSLRAKAAAAAGAGAAGAAGRAPGGALAVAAAEAAAAAADDDMLDQASSSFKSTFVRLVFALPKPSPMAANFSPRETVGAIFQQFGAKATAAAGAAGPDAQKALQELLA